jgi:hypothetical protein
MNAGALYTGSLIFLLAVGLILELHYSQLYPYLKRGKAVTTTGWVPPPPQQSVQVWQLAQRTQRIVVHDTGDEPLHTRLS